MHGLWPIIFKNIYSERLFLNKKLEVSKMSKMELSPFCCKLFIAHFRLAKQNFLIQIQALKSWQVEGSKSLRQLRATYRWYLELKLKSVLKISRLHLLISCKNNCSNSHRSLRIWFKKLPVRFRTYCKYLSKTNYMNVHLVCKF